MQPEPVADDDPTPVDEERPSDDHDTLDATATPPTDQFLDGYVPI